MKKTIKTILITNIIYTILFLNLVSAADSILPSATTLGSSAFGILYNILYAFVAIVGLFALFFGSRAGFGAWKKRKNYKIHAVIFNRDGTWYTKRIGKFRTKDNIDKMLFQGSNETMPVIDTAHIRANRVVLWRYGPGQYAVIPPRVWERTRPEKFGIEVINMQAKNFAFLEQRAAVSRWAYIKDTIQRFAPYITMMILAVMVGVAVWFLMKLGYNIYHDAIIARTLECRQLSGGTVG